MSKKKSVITLAIDKDSITAIKDANKQLRAIYKALQKVGFGLQSVLKKGFKPISTE